jgi:hypothetical protein
MITIQMKEQKEEEIQLYVSEVDSKQQYSYLQVVVQ